VEPNLLLAAVVAVQRSITAAVVTAHFVAARPFLDTSAQSWVRTDSRPGLDMKHSDFLVPDLRILRVRIIREAKRATTRPWVVVVVPVVAATVPAALVTACVEAMRPIWVVWARAAVPRPPLRQVSPLRLILDRH